MSYRFLCVDGGAIVRENGKSGYVGKKNKVLVVLSLS